MFELGSEAWVEMAREKVFECAEGADLSGVDVKYNEVMINSPSSIGPDAEGRVGWYIIVENCKISVGRGILENPSYALIMDYDELRAASKVVYSGNPEIRKELAEKAITLRTEGKLHELGSIKAMAPLAWLAPLHDKIAVKTI